jgi:hypothetical protein
MFGHPTENRGVAGSIRPSPFAGLRRITRPHLRDPAVLSTCLISHVRPRGLARYGNGEAFALAIRRNRMNKIKPPVRNGRSPPHAGTPPDSFTRRSSRRLRHHDAPPLDRRRRGASHTDVRARGEPERQGRAANQSVKGRAVRSLCPLLELRVNVHRHLGVGVPNLAHHPQHIEPAG